MSIPTSRHVMTASIIACSSILGACTTSSSPAAPATSPEEAALPSTPDEAVEARLERLLTGKFDSKDQAKADKSYYAIDLTVCAVDAPELGPRVLYVEQALEGARPYRQRLYVIERVSESAARSRVFELSRPEAMFGACSEASPRVLSRRDVEERAGCVVEMHWVEGRFVGHTPDKRWTGDAFEAAPSAERCKSDLQGASYATTEVSLDEGKLLSWDRGWSAGGQQVWGATKAGYSFVRRSALAEPQP